MSTVLELLSGEIERLFSTSEMKELCINYLGIDPSTQGIEDAVKSVFAKKIVEFCHRNNAVEAMTDAVISLKKSTADPRLQQVLTNGVLSEDLRPQTELNGYVVESRIGEDEIGEIYSCFQKGFSQRYRLTVMYRERAQNHRVAQRWLMLMRLLKNNPKPSVASVKEAGMLEDGRPYAVSADVEGAFLSERIPMSSSEALRLLEGIMDALEPLHDKGIVHGDLNSKNICILSDVNEEAEVVLTGLGADRLLSASAPPIGIAPEMLRRYRADTRSDIYALGALLYEAVSGKPMFSGELPIDLAAAHAVLPTPAVSAACDDPTATALDKFIAQLSAKDPAARPKNLGFVRRKLDEIKRQVEQLEVQSKTAGTREDIGLPAATFLQYPQDPESLNALLNEAQAVNAWAAAAEVIEEAASSVGDMMERRRLFMVAANIAFRKMKDYERALALYDYILHNDSFDTEALTSSLEVLEAAGRYEELIQRLGSIAEATQDPAERIATLKRIAVLYDKKLKNAESAFQYYIACLTGTGEDLELLYPLERLAESAGQYENLAAALAQAASAAEGAGDAETALSFYEKLGKIYLEKLDQPGYAVTCFQKVLQYRPSDTEAVKSMADLYRAAQQWPEAAQVIMSLAEMETQPTLRRNHLVEAADIMHKRLGETAQALSILEAVSAEDPGHRGALDAMTAIFEASHDYARLANVLSIGLQSIADPKEKVDVHVRLGALCENQLGDIAAVKNHYEIAAAENPQCLEALKGLDHIYMREGNTMALRDNLEAQITCPMSPKQQAEIRVRLADLYEEEFKDAKKAAAHLEAVLAIDDSHRYAMLTLTRIYRRDERWEDLVNLLEKRAKLSQDDEKKGLLKERAEIIRDKLKDAARAIQALTEVTSLGVDDALETLAGTQEESGDFQAAIETLHKIENAAPDMLSRQAVMMRIAAVELDKIGNVDAAVSTLKRAREFNPANRDVLSMLSRAFIAMRNYAEALATLGQQADMEETPSGKAAILGTLGTVCLEYLDDRDRALVYFRQSLLLDETNFDSAVKLLRIYRQVGEIEEAIPLYRKWADAVHFR